MSLHIGFLVVCLVASTSCTGRILNPVVLLTGGLTDIGTAELTVEVFIPWQNSSCSKDLKDLSKGRIGHTVNFFKGDVIMCGGILEYNGKFLYHDSSNKNGTLEKNGKDCQSLDKNQKFIPHSQLNKERSFHTAAVVSDTLVIVGGDWSKAKSMESWNGSQWVMQEINPDEVKDVILVSCMAAVSEDTILMAGGGGSGIKGTFTNKMYKYKNGVWERMEDFPGPPRGSHGCAFVETPEGDSFLIGGGANEETYFDTSYLYNIEKKQWEEVGKLASPRTDGKIVVIDGRIFFLGGGQADSSMPVDVEEYNVEKKTWTTIQQKIKRGRNFFDAVVLPGALFGF